MSAVVGQVCNLQRVFNPLVGLRQNRPAPAKNRRAGYNPAPQSKPQSTQTVERSEERL